MDTNCPKCFKSLNPSPQFISHITLCAHCGWKRDNNTRQPSPQFLSNKKMQKSITSTMTLLSMAFLIISIHLSQWGSHSLNVVYLKLSHWTRLASSREYEKLALICERLKKYDCLEENLKLQYQFDNKEETLKKLAQWQFKLNNSKEALVTFEQYFHPENNYTFDPQLAFTFAKLLTTENKLEEAIEVYNKILQHQGQYTVSINVLRNQIHLLKKVNRIEEAQRLLQSYASLIPQTDVILTQEINHLRKILSSNT